MEKTKATLAEIKNRRGFTLVELIVVMAILGLLATVGLASFRSSQIKGRDAQRKHDLGQLQRGLEAYYNDKGVYPDPTALPGPRSPWQDESVEGGTLYMKEIPDDPTTFSYKYESSDGTYYKIFAHLENEKDKDLVPETGCDAVRGTNCGGSACNYGVSSANVRVCD